MRVPGWLAPPRSQLLRDSHPFLRWPGPALLLLAVTGVLEIALGVVILLTDVVGAKAALFVGGTLAILGFAVMAVWGRRGA
jgi:hypothetical protein